MRVRPRDEDLCAMCEHNDVAPDSLFCARCEERIRYRTMAEAEQIPLFTSIGRLRLVERVEASEEFV